MFNNMKYIVVGYKIEQKEYNCVNMVLSQICYCIYKTYFISDRRSKQINILNYLYFDLLAIQAFLRTKDTCFRFLNDYIKNINCTINSTL